MSTLEARQIAKRMKADHVSSFLDPVTDSRDALKRKGIRPKDYAKENREKLQRKEQELRSKRMQDEWEKENTVPWKLKEFRDVGPRVSAEPRLPPPESRGSGVDSSSSIRKGQASSATSSYRKPISSAMPGPRHVVYDEFDEAYEKEFGGRKEESISHLTGMRGQRSGVSAAPKGVRGAPQPKVASKQSSSAVGDARSLNPSFGKVPEYLEQRKRLKEAEDNLRRIEEETAAPPGLVLLSEEERLDTLMNLHAAREDVNTQINKLPIAVKTQASEKRRLELEDRLKEIDENIKAFSKEKVYIKVDE
ncbi:putative Calmodulin-binding [Monocercomonoides exilis]|uniref:putative Calmodulin-binding n=1 Tax=Monocercomonoides exilis TaxID=2049356 RepID=UPI00355A622A|nr:putative Calmodulin-binding [Monocercomonoides exilis]|eukprot:MONOS_4447.1-p1 / transcript=MONOS_4447.1 / gene=MONOS_4447 / organism=Monocercomonoides_exilis_PA203 / gene_product=unspecified product / transcript_product=unspecified product / location=Mono_scaffold00118:45201-46612(-) / protein_length=305 / sequence_SO=supercontig / SO=protein_coding / is_pseudo=false